jgi:hypothetical protein
MDYNSENSEAVHRQLKSRRDKLSEDIRHIERLLESEPQAPRKIALSRNTTVILSGVVVMLLLGLVFGWNLLVFAGLIGLGSMGLYVFYPFFTFGIRRSYEGTEESKSHLQIELDRLRNELLEIQGKLGCMQSKR